MRALLALSFFALTFAGVGHTLLALGERHGGSAPTGPDPWRIVPREIAAAQAPRADEGRVLLLLGDSSIGMYPHGRTLHDRLRQELRRRRAGIRVHTISYGGMHPFDQYVLSHALSSAKPDIVVLALNPGVFADRWVERMARPEMAAWVPPSRWAEAAALPLHLQGVTLNGMLLDSSVHFFGLTDAWLAWRERARQVGRAFAARSAAMNAVGGDAERPRTLDAMRRRHDLGEGEPRDDERQLRERLGPALRGVDEDHPVLTLIRAAVQAYLASGAEVWAFIVPVNVEHWDRVGVLDEGFERTLASLRATVEDAGGVVLDLHALLGDAYFRDPAGHYISEAPFDGPKRVAAHLADSIAPAPSRRAGER